MSTKIYYNKMIRDHIKDVIEAKGKQCEVRRIDSDAEYQQELTKKVIEEATGLAFSRTRDEFLANYADLMVVLDALTAQLEVSEAEISTAISENVEKKGLYAERHYLHWSDDDTYISTATPQGIR